MRLLFIAAFMLLQACASTGTAFPAASAVGPKALGQGQGLLAAVDRPVSPTTLSLNIAMFDPGLPEDPADYERQGVWPELRRTEAARFPLQIAQAVEDGGRFSRVRLAPDTTAAASLYLQGVIVESNGEDVKVALSVTGIDGKVRLKKQYSHRVRAYALDDPRAGGEDLYAPLFEKIAADVNALAESISRAEQNSLASLEFLRFALAFSPEYFSRYLAFDRRGRTELVGRPSKDDPMALKVEAVRIKDRLFLDKLQDNYESFYGSVDTAYTAWQRGAYVESKASREARNKRNVKVVLGVLAVAAGTAVAADADTDSTEAAGAVTAVAGLAAIASGLGDSKQAAAHQESLAELGRSLNAELSPTVIRLEDEVLEFTGSAAEQYRSWQAYLKKIYEIEQTPAVSL